MRPGLLVERPASEEDWHAIRATRIGGSDVGALGADDPVLAVACMLVSEPMEPTRPMILGTCLERGVRDAAGHLWPALAADPAHDGLMYRHPDLPYAGYTPDGISRMGELLEIKCSGNRSGHWGRGMSKQVPYRYYLQVQYGMWVLGLDCAWIVRLSGGADEGLRIRRHPIPYDGHDDWYEAAADALWQARRGIISAEAAVASIDRETGLLL